MNKIISINLKGIIFQMEESAYDKLKAYIESLNRHFSKEESRVEILDDIETRIAEMMQDRLKTKSAITEADIDEITGIMGRPGDFDQSNPGDDAEATENAETETEGQRVKRRLFRDTDNSVLGGVCSGFAAYFDIDPIWIRLGFLGLFFLAGTGFIFYIILWIIIPEAKTYSDRLQMRGEKVTVDNIEKTIKDEFERLKKNINDISSKHDAKGKIKTGLTRSLGALGDIVAWAIRFVSKVLGAFLIFWSIILLVAVIMLFYYFSVNGTLPLISLAFDTADEFQLTAVSVLTLLFITFMGLVFSGVNLFNGHSKFPGKASRIILSSISFICIVILGIMGFRYAQNFSVQRSTTVTVGDLGTRDTLVISSYNPLLQQLFGSYDPKQAHDYRSAEFSFSNGEVNFIKTGKNAIKNDSMWRIARLEIEPTDKPNWELEVIKIARGSDEYHAIEQARMIPDGYTITDTLLTFNTHYYLGNSVPYRAQYLLYKLKMPRNKVLKMHKGVWEILEPGERRCEVNGEALYIMGKDGLKCLTCPTCTESNSQWGNGTSYDIKNFNSVKVSAPVTVNIRQGDNYSVQLFGPEESKRKMRISKEGDFLDIDAEDENGFFIWSESNNLDNVTVEVTMPSIEKMKASGASTVYLKMPLNKPDCSFTVSGASLLEADMQIEDLDIEVSGASSATLKGTAHQFKADISGASKLNAQQMAAENCTISSSGASRAHINSVVKLDADASGASHIYYSGNPTVKTDASGASSIEKQ